MAILTQEQLSSIKNSFRKGVFAASLIAALMMAKPSEAQSNGMKQLPDTGRVNLDDTIKINHIIKEFEDKVGVIIPKEYKKYVTEGLKDLDSVRKSKIYESLEREKKSGRYTDWDIYILLLSENLRNRSRVLQGLRKETPIYDGLLEKYGDDEYGGKYGGYNASCSEIISSIENWFEDEKIREEYTSGRKK